MKSIVFPSKLKGKIKVPSSKSYAQRAIIIAALCEGTSTIHCSDIADDTKTAINAAEALGAKIEYRGAEILIRGKQNPINNEFQVDESGLTGRVISSILLFTEETIKLDATEELRKRPFEPILSVAQQLEKAIKCKDNTLPFQYSGSYKLDDLVVEGSISSQFISGLLIGLAQTKFKHELRVSNIVSRPYIDMTIEILKKFNVFWDEVAKGVFKLNEKSELQKADYKVESDWSTASLIYACGAIAGDLKISGLLGRSLQGDKAILQATNPDFTRGILNTKGDIPSFEFDATQCPDLFPPLAALAVYSSGTCQIKGTHRLINKESNRAIAIQEEFGKLGIEVILEKDTMIIHPSKVKHGTVYAHHDHRIAMALTAIALGADGPVEIEGAECVSKSYPHFYRDLIKLGAKIELI